VTDVVPLNTEERDGWIIITADNGSSILTKDGSHHYIVTPEGCSCGKANCAHYRVVYSIPKPVPPKPPAVRNHNVDIRNGHPAGEPEECELERKPFKLPKGNFSAGLFVTRIFLSSVLKGVGFCLIALGELITPEHPE